MAKNVKKTNGLEEVATATEKKVVNNIDSIIREELVIREGNVYNNYDPEKEPAVQKGFDTLIEFVDNNSNMSNEEKMNLKMAIALGKFWNDREKFNSIRRDIIEPTAIKQGLDICDFEQENLRASYEGLDGILKAVTRMNYAFNYLKPRSNYQRKEAMQEIRIKGKTRFIGKKTLKALKDAQAAGEITLEEMKEKIWQASTDNKPELNIEEF